MSRGDVVWRDGACRARPGRGQFIARYAARAECWRHEDPRRQPEHVGEHDRPAAARAGGGEGARDRVDGRQSDEGPAAIESAEDEALAIPPMLALIREAAPRHDAVVIACFSDPGLEQARQLVSIPVVGIEESSLHLAAPARPPLHDPHVARRARAGEARTRRAPRPVQPAGVGPAARDGRPRDGRRPGPRPRAHPGGRRPPPFAKTAPRSSCSGARAWRGTRRALGPALGVPVIDPSPVALATAEMLVSQVIVGCVIGIGLYKGVRNINFRLLGEIALGWIATPVISGLLTFFSLFFVKNIFNIEVGRKNIEGGTRSDITAFSPDTHTSEMIKYLLLGIIIIGIIAIIFYFLLENKKKRELRLSEEKFWKNLK